jgi:hypothetical protein
MEAPMLSIRSSTANALQHRGPAYATPHPELIIQHHNNGPFPGNGSVGTSKLVIADAAYSFSIGIVVCAAPAIEGASAIAGWSTA